MKKAEVKIGETYAVRVSGKVQPVKITREQVVPAYRSGRALTEKTVWHGTNLNSGRQIYIRSAAKLRYLWSERIVIKSRGMREVKMNENPEGGAQ